MLKRQTANMAFNRLAKPQCDCIAKFNERCAPQRSMLECDLISGSIVIRTITTTPGQRRSNGLPYLMCTYCPMCGVKYR